ncbi:MAG: protein kinase [Actinomycetia bacterium]|nr:protein kinase [Actinomycetes bacterium]
MEDQIDLGIEHLTDVMAIGHGGFSYVYAATHTLLGSRVAVKVLGELAQESDRRRFERECRVLGQVSGHPNVVTVHHAGYSSHGRPYLIMELVTGGTLTDLLSRVGTVPWIEAVDYVLPVAEALAVVHEAGILHRDIKPENILLTESGAPKLADFGIAYLRDATGATSTRVTASWLHTPPETFENQRDERSDIYSLASTLYNLIAGQAPFWREGEDSLNPLMYRLLAEPPPHLSPTVSPPALDGLLQGALSKDPNERPQTVRHFIAELSELQAPTSSAQTVVADLGQAEATPGPETPTVDPTGPESPVIPPVIQPPIPPPPASEPTEVAPITPQASIGPPGMVPPGNHAGPTAKTAETLAASPGFPATPPAQPGAERGDSSTRRNRLLLLMGAAVVAAIVLGSLAAAQLLEPNDPDVTTATGDGGSSGSSPGEGDTETGSDGAGTGPVVDLTSSDGRLEAVMARGQLICGINGSLPGFGLIDSAGNHSGFDVEMCRAVAAGILGDADAIEFVPLTAAERFTALQSGQIDVLMRNTSWTASRDGQQMMDFVFTTFYDGQSMMVPASSGVQQLSELDGATVCVVGGTTTELNLSVELPPRGVQVAPLGFDETASARSAYEQGQCDAWTNDRTQLATQKLEIEADGGAEQLILAETFSQEPLGPAVLDGDPAWSQAVRWSVMATVLGWQLGLDSGNVDGYDGSNAQARRFLGLDGFDAELGLDPGFGARIIRQVGNYGEIYGAHLLPIGLTMAGSPNTLLSEGGLLYVPPFR